MASMLKFKMAASAIVADILDIISMQAYMN